MPVKQKSRLPTTRKLAASIHEAASKGLCGRICHGVWAALTKWPTQVAQTDFVSLMPQKRSQAIMRILDNLGIQEEEEEEMHYVHTASKGL